MPICMARPGPYELYVQYETAETSEDEAIAGPTWQLVAGELRVGPCRHRNMLQAAIHRRSPRLSLCCAGLLVVNEGAVPRRAG